VALWNTPLTTGKALALYNLASDSALQYGSQNADALFQLYDSHGSGSVGGAMWYYATGLSGTDGQVLNHNTVVLNAALGTGVTTIPEPCGMVLVATALISLLAYAWRKRG
jgi:hypothetical protein